jgi:hypothetical protein
MIRLLSFWILSASAVLLLFIVDCSQINDLPRTADAAFALPDVGRSGTTLVQTFTVKATLNDAMKAAEYALTSTDFDPRQDSWTKERRCGEYTTGWYDWAMWGCFYFQPTTDGMIRSRVIVESWNSFGVKTRQPWHLHLVTAFQNRLRDIQGVPSQ